MIRDCLGDMAALVWPQVIREPVVREGDPASDDPGTECLAAPGAGVVRYVIDTDAPSYRRRSPVSVLQLKRREFTVQLWRTGEETLHLLFYQLMACCSMRPRTLLNVYLPVWPPGGRSLFLMF